MTALKTKHKVGLGIAVLITAVVLILGVTGAFLVYNHYTIGTGSNPNADNSQLSDSIAVHKTGFIASSNTPIDQIVSQAKASNVYHVYAPITVKGLMDQVVSFMLTPFRIITQSGDTVDHGKITGIVYYIARHADGTVYSVTQSHNTRTVEGINCAENILFANATEGVLNTNGSNVCQGLDVRGPAGFNGFNKIILGNRSTTTANTLNGSDTVTLSKIGGTRASSASGLILTQTGGEGGPRQGTSKIAGTSTYNQITITSHVYNFTNIRATGTIITMAFLANNTSATSTLDVAFAENSFTGVSVTSSDTIQIVWTITMT
jgi:hypothetical protein